MESSNAIVDVFWSAYLNLKNGQKRQLARRILLDSEMPEDWIDHALIERARKEPGKDVSLELFLKKMKP
jgi:type IV secretory pathway VirD2 relaxase